MWAVAYSPDGERLFSGSQDRTIRIWPTRAQLIADAICGHVERDLSPEEWKQHLGDVEYEATCPKRLADRRQ